MGFGATGTSDIACQKCGAVHVVEWIDRPDRDRSKVVCEVPGCDGIVIETKTSRDWGPACLKEPNA